jgi:hypothetical protein
MPNIVPMSAQLSATSRFSYNTVLGLVQKPPYESNVIQRVHQRRHAELPVLSGDRLEPSLRVGPSR